MPVLCYGPLILLINTPVTLAQSPGIVHVQYASINVKRYVYFYLTGTEFVCSVLSSVLHDIISVACAVLVRKKFTFRISSTFVLRCD